ncbi:MAG: molybdopterin-synthase adenylyltransferase MoeB [Immundisolibacteraceae bacterium]|nr:molybdopterin-synthase adenylyltransferase MoeB [Immundisolibacteraceae bacterium]
MEWLADNDLLMRYSRQVLLPQLDVEGQDKLVNARVLVVGMGGLGTPVAMYLAGAGIGELIIADYDHVELSNLHRQVVHSTADIDRPKVESARDRMLAINPEVTVTTITSALDADTLLEWVQQVTVVVDACDNFATRFAVNEACVQAGVPLVSGAAIRMEGQLSVYDSRDENSPCYRCLFSDESAEEETCSQTGVLGPVVGTIGSLQALETIKLIAGIGKPLVGRLLLFDGLQGEWQRVQLKRDPGCPVCSPRGA